MAQTATGDVDTRAEQSSKRQLAYAKKRETKRSLMQMVASACGVSLKQAPTTFRAPGVRSHMRWAYHEGRRGVA